MVARALLLAAATLVMSTITRDASQAQGYPEAKEGSYIARDVRFGRGEGLTEVKLADNTIGDPKNDAVIVLHGTTGSGASIQTQEFKGQLFRPDQPIKTTKNLKQNTVRTSPSKCTQRYAVPKHAMHRHHWLLSWHENTEHVCISCIFLQKKNCHFLKIKLLQLQCDHTSFLIMFFNSDTIFHSDRLFLCKYRSS